MKQDLGALLKAGTSIQVFGVYRIDRAYPDLHFHAATKSHSRSGEIMQASIIFCHFARDYCIRPPNPSIIMGAPFIEYHDQHKLLDDPSLQYIPGNDDGERYDPPSQLKLLIMDQTFVIAQRFEIQFIPNDMKPTPAKS